MHTSCLRPHSPGPNWRVSNFSEDQSAGVTGILQPITRAKVWFGSSTTQAVEVPRPSISALPRKRRSAIKMQIRRATSQLTHCSKTPGDCNDLLDHLVGGDEQCLRHGKAEHCGGLDVNNQLELARLHNRQIRRLGAVEDTARVGAALLPRIRNVSSVAHQPADFGIVARGI